MSRIGSVVLIAVGVACLAGSILLAGLLADLAGTGGQLQGSPAPLPPPPEGKSRGRYLFLQAQELGDQGRVQDSAALYRLVYETEKDTPLALEAKTRCAICEFPMGRRDEAIRLATDAAEATPRDQLQRVRRLCTVGVFLRLAGRLDEAAAFYRQRIETESGVPESERLIVSLMGVLNEKSDWAETIEVFRKYERKLRSSGHLTDALWHLGQAYEGKGDRGAARRCYTMVIRMGPDCSHAEEAREALAGLDR
jgi:tetratricopeptide (TPR) repeat protein